jgi:serine/threonine-protein kinase PpkA
VIEIPGYRILRQLGRGGMATVYLATQESVQRDVALKIMSPTLLADPDFGERFLREARIAAKLHHRNVVGVHDVGRIADHHYIAMEYLGGGTVLSDDGTPRPVTFSLRVTREIAAALNYAHAKGFVHRDVKPDNILLRDDGSAALTDFGIARATDASTSMTRTGTVIGTPHYMSPEQARGRTIDGRADLYSLGIVLYELLVGRVPFHADDSLAVGIMHITQPPPALPQQFSALQPLLDRMLAKQPIDRYQSGAELADAIEQVEIEIARGDLPQLAPTSDAYRREILGVDTPARGVGQTIMDTPTRAMPSLSTPTPPPPGAQRYRAEPSIGRIDEFAANTSRRPMQTSARAAPSGSKAWLWIILAIVVLGGGFAAWRYQDRLRGLLPKTELNDLISRGQKALAEGKLVGTQGDSARELFQAARTLDADNDMARQGLSKVGERLVEQASAAITRNDFVTARTDLAAATDVLGGGAEIEELKARLHSSESRTTQSSDLLARGDQELAAGHLLGTGSAAEAYQKMLDADGANGLAISGLKKVGEALAKQARDAMAAGNNELANQRVGELAQLSPNHPAIPELRAALANQRADSNQALEQQLSRAEAQQRAGKISGDDGALALFEAALKRDPNNARAKAALKKIAQGLVVQANAALDDSNVAQADKLLQQAETAAPDLPDIRAAKTRLREAREQLDIGKQQTQTSAADAGRAQTLLDEAEKAMAAGNLILPPGDSAWDKYRAVLRIDGNNSKAFAGINRIPARAKELFEQALKDNTPYKARSYIDTITQADPGDVAAPAMKERLANVLLDQADARITQNQRADATRALNAVRELAPANPRLAPLQAKLQALPGG